jgi:DNA polymerase IV
MLVACFVVPQLGIACERLRLPEVVGQPLVLVEDGDHIRVVSDEAAAGGIATGQTAACARTFCPSVTVLPYDKEAYGAAAWGMWDLVAEESSCVEPAAPEVVYAGLPYIHAHDVCRRLIPRMTAEAGAPVSAGLAAGRFVARTAALRAQPGEVHSVAPGREGDFLEEVPLAEARLLDREGLERLARLGLRTFGDLERAGTRGLRQHIGSAAVLLQRLAHGQDGDPLRPVWPPRTFSHCLRFEYEVRDFAVVELALSEIASELSSRLGQGREFCRRLILRVAFADGSRAEEGEKLGAPLSRADGLYRAAARLLGRIGVRKGVLEIELAAGDISAGSGIQLALLDGNAYVNGLPGERARRLTTTVAYLRKRFGEQQVRTANAMPPGGRITLWTTPLGRRHEEAVEVETDGRGVPKRIRWSGRERRVTGLHDRWHETQGLSTPLADKQVFRVETDAGGVSELWHVGGRWKLRAGTD